MTVQIKQLKEKKTDEIFYPVTVGEAVIFEDGRNLTETLYNSNNSKYIKTTCDNIKLLKHNNQLIPGSFYQITDYEYDVVDGLSAEHQFDIIVQAINNNTLSEDAKAIKHDIVGTDTGFKSITFQGEHFNYLKSKYVKFKDGYRTLIDIFNNSDSICWVKYEGLGNWSALIVSDSSFVENDDEIITTIYDDTWFSSPSSYDFLEFFDYFYESDLSAWKLKYCLEPTEERFEGKIIENVSGFVRISISPTFNDCNFGHDKDNLFRALGTRFNNISTTKVKNTTNVVKSHFLSLGFDNETDLYTMSTGYSASLRTIKTIWVVKEEAESDNIDTIVVGGKTSSDGTWSYLQSRLGDTFTWESAQKIQHATKGYIYEMIDEFGNNANYDFKNKLLQGSYYFGDDSSIQIQYPIYTFNQQVRSDDTYIMFDASVLGKAKNNYVRVLYERGNYHFGCVFLSGEDCTFINNKFDTPRIVGIYCDQVKNVTINNDSIAFCKRYDNNELIPIDYLNDVKILSNSTFDLSPLYYDAGSYADGIVLYSGSITTENNLYNCVVIGASVTNPENNTVYVKNVTDSSIPTDTTYHEVTSSNAPLDVTSSLPYSFTSYENEWKIKNGLGEIIMNNEKWYPTTINGKAGYRSEYEFFYYDSTQDKYYIDLISNLQS